MMYNIISSEEIIASFLSENDAKRFAARFDFSCIRKSTKNQNLPFTLYKREDRGYKMIPSASFADERYANDFYQFQRDMELIDSHGNLVSA